MAYSTLHMKLHAIIVALAVGLLIQNTCPQGYAGKSSVVPACSHCPLKQLHSSAPNAQNLITSDASSVHFPMFIFSIPKTIHTFNLVLAKSSKPVILARYQDALPHELLRPPQA